MLSRRPNRGLLRDRELFAKVRCERWGWSNFCMCLECGGLEVVMQGGRKHDDVQLYRTLQSPALTGQKWASSPLMQHTSNDKEVTFRGLYPNIILSQSPPGRCACMGSLWHVWNKLHMEKGFGENLTTENIREAMESSCFVMSNMNRMSNRVAQFSH